MFPGLWAGLRPATSLLPVDHSAPGLRVRTQGVVISQSRPFILFLRGDRSLVSSVRPSSPLEEVEAGTEDQEECQVPFEETPSLVKTG